MNIDELVRGARLLSAPNRWYKTHLATSDDEKVIVKEIDNVALWRKRQCHIRAVINKGGVLPSIRYLTENHVVIEYVSGQVLQELTAEDRARVSIRIADNLRAGIAAVPKWTNESLYYPPMIDTLREGGLSKKTVEIIQRIARTDVEYHPSIIHGDLHEGNLVSTPSGRVVPIDIEELRVGAAEYDLAKPFARGLLDTSVLAHEIPAIWHSFNANASVWMTRYWAHKTPIRMQKSAESGRHALAQLRYWVDRF